MDETMEKINIVFVVIAVLSLVLSIISIGVTYTIISLYPPSTFQMQNTQTNPKITPTTQLPKITSVTPITDKEKQTIIIEGDGFGNLQPQLEHLEDGSVDTIWGQSTPSIVILDQNNLLSAGAAGDWSGFTNGPPDLIGIYLVSWTNTKIVLGGFGTGLDSQFSWNQVKKGDPLQIQIQTTDGQATYNIAIT
jgi:hypothetical protein